MTPRPLPPEQITAPVGIGIEETRGRAREITPLFTRARRLVVGLVVVVMLVAAGQAKAREGATPIPAPTALLRARAVCPVAATRTCYLTALRHAYASIEWSKRERIHRYQPTVAFAIAVACASQPTVDCSWLRSMIRCESKNDPHAKNRVSTAKGLAEFLDGTWRATPFAAFDVYDPIANALAAAWLAARSGHDPWNASRGCWA